MLRKGPVSKSDDDLLGVGSDPRPDAEPSDMELREAEMLARALERGVSPEAPPEEALEAALLLRVAQDPALSSSRRQAIWEELAGHRSLSVRSTHESEEVRPFAWFWLLVPAFGVGALVLYLGVGDTQSGLVAMKAAAAEGIPPPSPQLLEAQARLLGARAPTSSERREFTERMGEYRSAVLSVLEERHRP
jgi:hypothetical protein